MKALVLAAGYATRLYPLTLNKPKPLLSVGKRLVIEHIIERIGEVEEINEILIITNQKFFSYFQEWLKNFRFSPTLKGTRRIELLNDGTLSNEDRLGAIGDIEFAITKRELNCDLLIVAGDNLFEDSLAEFVKFSKEKIPYVSIGLYDVGDKALVKKFGAVEIDKHKRIVDFQEKPLFPKSSLAAKCLYFFPKDKLSLVSQYLKKENNIKDAPGYYIEWLSKREKVFGFVFKGNWFDIGDIVSYKQAKQTYGGKTK